MLHCKPAETERLISETQKLASAIGIEGTPAYIIGNTLVPGAIGLDGLRKVILGETSLDEVLRVTQAEVAEL